jgi:hypothetical protein
MEQGSTGVTGLRRLPPWILAVSAAILVLYVAFAATLWRLGLFDVPESGPDARIFAAVFGLLGGLFASILTFVGVLLKHSIDTRTLEITRDSEARLKLETSIRAVELLATDDGRETAPSQQAGALFALANLGQLGLAVALLNELWPAGRVSTAAATGVIDQALRVGSIGTQIGASRVLQANADLLRHTDRGILLPDSLDGEWHTEWPGGVRNILISALIDAIRYRPRSEWSTDDLSTLSLNFDQIRKLDPDPVIAAAAVLVTNVLLELRFLEDTDAFLTADGQRIQVGALRSEIASLVPDARINAAYSDRDLVESLRTSWETGDAPPPKTRAGRSTAQSVAGTRSGFTGETDLGAAGDSTASS